ncbi:DUF4136 domain-containing protein [Hyphomonas sp. GM-8P]|uniref:DUF4136 domain-containing protein n=1 Tax=Hyphomonas sp. GM-8P TaxID=1280945 RepID=UPI000DBF964A|nr:DUF4136 domain-containing protein [Hyphomonas sp. GM-8P]RAN38693.1 hypothetical protein HY26_17710 [Hyphomonas sp. GM-8P]
MFKWALVLISLALIGCASSAGQTFNVVTNSLSSPEVTAGQRYMVWPMDPAVQISDLQFDEYAKYAERALESRGFTKAQESETPDIIVLLGYGIGAPETKSVSYSVPVFGQTGVKSATTTGTSNATAFGTGNYVNAFGNYSQTTTYTPQYGVTGYQTGTRNYTVFTRYIRLAGFFVEPNVDASEWRPAFQTDISSTGSSGDLRYVFPIMMAAAADKVATNTGRGVADSLKEDDGRILAIKSNVMDID